MLDHKQAEIRFDLGMSRRDPRRLPNPYAIINMTHPNGSLSPSKRLGFKYYVPTTETQYDNTVKGNGLFVFYKANGDKYLFEVKGKDLCVEKYNATTLETAWIDIIINFFGNTPSRVRGAAINNRFFFVDANNALRWYDWCDEEPDTPVHFWATAELDTPILRIADNSTLDYGYGHSFVDHVDYNAGIETCGIWQYKQTYSSFADDYQILEEGNSGAASKMFTCQFNTNDGGDGYGVGLQGYIKGGVPLAIADAEIVDTIRKYYLKNTNLYRRHKQYADDLFTPFHRILTLPYTWSTEVNDGSHISRDSTDTSRDTASPLIDDNDSAPIAEYIDVSNYKIFLGKVTHPVGKQPALDPNFREKTGAGGTYSANFTYRVPIVITNTDTKTHTRAIIPLKFQTDTDASHVATPLAPFNRADWTGAYLDTDLVLNLGATGWWQIVFTDSDGVTPLGHCMTSVDATGTNHRVSFEVEIPEFLQGDNTIYMYFEDAELATLDDPDDCFGQPGNYSSVYHRPLLYSNHLLMTSFEESKGVTAMNHAANQSFKATNTAALEELVAGSFYFGNNSDWVEISQDDDTEMNYAAKVTYHADGSYFHCPQTDIPSDMTAKTIKDVVMLSAVPTTDFNIIAHGRPDGDFVDTLVLGYDFSETKLTATYYRSLDFGGSSTASVTLDWTDRPWVMVWAKINYASKRLSVGYITRGNDGHWAATSVPLATNSGYLDNVTTVDIAAQQSLELYQHPDSGEYIYHDNVECFMQDLNDDELKALYYQETYQPGGGMAILDDIETIGESVIKKNHIVWSKTNQPDAFPATNYISVGNVGEPITGIKGFGNYLYGFKEQEIRPLLVRSSGDIVGSEDVGQWELNKDITRQLGGLGVYAPDTLIEGELKGLPVLYFYAKKGIHAFDGKQWYHISEDIDPLIEAETPAKRREAQMIYHPLQKRLLFSLRNANSWILVGDANPDMQKYSEAFKWKQWDGYYADYFAVKSMTQDSGELLWSAHTATTESTVDYYLIYQDRLAGNYTDIYTAVTSSSGITARVTSPIYMVNDAELQRAILECSGSLTSLIYYLDGVAHTLSDISSGEIGFPVGSDATYFQFKLEDTSDDALELYNFVFEFLPHRKRRL